MHQINIGNFTGQLSVTKLALWFIIIDYYLITYYFPCTQKIEYGTTGSHTLNKQTLMTYQKWCNCMGVLARVSVC